MLGIISENLFVNECSKRDIPTFKNINDIGEIDYVIIFNDTTLRLQIKSTATKKRNSWLISTKRTGNRLYSNIDYFACYIHDLKDWYIVPAEVIGDRQSISVTTTDNKYYQFKNNWNLATETKKEEIFDRNVSARSKAINLFKEGVAKAEIARRLNVHYSVINRWLREAGLGIRKLSAKEGDLRKLYNTGKTMKEVGQELGLTVWTTRNLFRKYNIDVRINRYKSNKIKELEIEP